MAKHGLPVYPIYDEMHIEPGQTPEEIEWLLEHGMLSRNVLALSPTEWKLDRLWTWEYGLRKDITDLFPKSGAGLPLCYQDVTKYQGTYIFIALDKEFRGDDPRCEHYVARQYDTLNELLAKEKITFTERRADAIWWRWLDSKPDLLTCFGEEVVYSAQELEAVPSD